jgi:hypothetical protein
MANKGLLFEWCIYYLAKRADPLSSRDPLFKQAAAQYKLAPADVKKAATSAVANVEKAYGQITDIKKISGGDEPKTDLIIQTKKKKLKCSLKYGGSIQLSSGGVKNTVGFLTGVLNNLKKEEGYNAKQITQIITALTAFEKSHGDIGKLPRHQVDKEFAKAERYDVLLKNILGSRQNPQVSEEYQKIKLAIIEEAMTGKFTFRNSDKSADHILTDKDIKKIDSAMIKKVADKTSVRLALKGRGKEEIAGKVVRLNEIVIRFDS